MQTILWIIFAVIIAGFLIADLGYFNRKAHKVTTKSAVIQTIFWVVISLIYAVLISVFLGYNQGAEFLSAYITEKMLSVDNLFVIMLIFGFFKIKQEYHHRVLFWGILGAIIFRGIFIGLGSVVIEHFHWILYIFGAFLVYTGLKLLKGDDDEEPDLNDNKVLNFAKKHLNIQLDEPTPHTKFTFKLDGKRYFTILFLTLLMIETTDIIFAVDSIPAVFSITQDPFIVFTSNMFAVMGLRALFFLVENLLQKFHHLQKGVSVVLVFIGIKMLLDIVNISISPLISLGAIIVTLLSSLILSVLLPQNDQTH